MKAEQTMSTRNDRYNETKTLTLEATEKYEIQVYSVLNRQKWAVTVYELPDRSVVTEDFFPDRQQAVNRAHDFRSIIVNKEMPLDRAHAHA